MADLQPTNANSSIMERAFMLVLEFGRFGTTRKASLGSVEVDADKTLLSLRKRLLKCDEYDAIASHDREIRKWIESIAVPFPVRHGSYLIPIPMIEAVQEGLERNAEQRRELVEAFLVVYPTKIVEIQTDLREMYNALDYPTVESVREKFKLDWQFLDYGVPGRLRHFNRALYEREREKAVAKIAEASDMIQQTMRAHTAELVAHMVDRLTPGPDGKKKVFKEASVTAFKEFIDGFASRNLTEDAELDAIIGQARGLLDGVDASQIREQDALRDALATGFQQIQTAMDGMVTTRSRKIIFAPSPSPAAEGEPEAAAAV